MPHGAERRRFEPCPPAGATPGVETGCCVIRRHENGRGGRDRGRIGEQTDNFVLRVIRKPRGTRSGSDRSARTEPSCGQDRMPRGSSVMPSL